MAVETARLRAAGLPACRGTYRVYRPGQRERCRQNRTVTAETVQQAASAASEKGEAGGRHSPPQLCDAWADGAYQHRQETRSRADA
jgi:hypothetical protein